MDDPAYLAALAEDADLGDPDLDEDPDCSPPPGLDDDQLAALIAEAREAAADQERAAGWRHGWAIPPRWARSARR